MRVRSMALCFVAGAAMAGAAQGTGQSAQQRRVDSGRYAFDANCVQEAEFLNCRMLLRDLVYDTVLGEPRISAMPGKQGGGLGSLLSFEGHPAVGKPQRFVLSLNPEELQGSRIARFLIEVHEGEHLVQRYSLAFPVTAGAQR